MTDRANVHTHVTATVDPTDRAATVASITDALIQQGKGIAAAAGAGAMLDGMLSAWICLVVLCEAEEVTTELVLPRIPNLLAQGVAARDGGIGPTAGSA